MEEKGLRTCPLLHSRFYFADARGHCVGGESVAKTAKALGLQSHREGHLEESVTAGFH